MEIKSDLLEQLEKMVSLTQKKSSVEIEGKLKLPITKPMFMRALQYLRSTRDVEHVHDTVLDIITDMEDTQYRLSLVSPQHIQSYCISNDIPEAIADSLEVIEKLRIKGYPSIRLDTLSSKIDVRDEVVVDSDTKMFVLENLSIHQKGYRLKKRFSYSDKTANVRFDLTIVKSSCKPFLSHYSFVDSKTNSSPESYEIEVELLPQSSKATSSKKKQLAKELVSALYEIYQVVSGPSSNALSGDEKQQVLKNYINLVFGKTKKFSLVACLEEAKIKPKKYFVGPQPVTLERQNMIEPDLGVITILDNYTVTEKADGERMLLFVNSEGRCFLINNRLDMIEMGIKLNNIVNTIIDGELITQDVNGNNISMFGIFDIYWDNGRDVRSLVLISDTSNAPSRLGFMTSFGNRTKERFLSKGTEIFVKEFRYANGTAIFNECKHILSNNAKYKYHTDGLIFTPKNLAVGAAYPGEFSPELPRGTWTRVFKWKPPQENTIDFLVTMKDEDFTVVDKKLHKVINLFVGYNAIQWENISPKDYLEKNIQTLDLYVAKSFMPGDVMDETFTQSYLPIDDESKSKLKCVNGDIIEHNSIVEFAYEPQDSKPMAMNWKPLRVRKDKTEMFAKFGLSGTANDYGTAMNIWRSIQYPVTECMIKGENVVSVKDIPTDDVYYYRLTSRDKFASRNMLDFHNQFIKNFILIRKFAGKDSLMDLSCGKGGDIPKWLDANIKNVLGVDIVKDNIENPIDGAIARTLQNTRYNKKTHKYVYATLDSSQQFTEDYINSLHDIDKKNAEVCKVLWGYTKPVSTSPLNDYYKFATQGFDVVSCQFSIHYFFENEKKLDNFVWNVDKHLKSGGYFVGTCLNGVEVKRQLGTLKKGQSISGRVKNRIMWNIKKIYEDGSNGSIGFGEPIEVYMESIGKVFTEYLVNMDILVKKFEAYGIHLLTKEECAQLDLDTPVESFKTSYQKLLTKYAQEESLKKVAANAARMSDAEKSYSFLNMFFVFKKESEVSAKKIIKKKVVAKLASNKV